MYPNWLGLAAAAGSGILFFFVRKLLLNLGNRSKTAASILFSILSIPGLTLPLYYLHILPDTQAYFQFRSIAGTELLVMPFGAAFGAYAACFRTRRTAVVLGAAGFALAFLPFMKPILGPLPGFIFEEKWNGDVCMQSTPATCGPSCAATIARSFGENVSEKQFARESHSYIRGTEAWHLARALRRRGYTAEFDFRDGFDSKIELPAIVGVKLGWIGHFIPILERTEDGNGVRYRIGDPLKGEEVLREAELLERYNFTGFYMLVRKN